MQLYSCSITLENFSLIKVSLLYKNLTTSSDIYSGGNIHLNNEFYIKGKNTTGTYYQLFGVDSEN